MGGKRKSSEKEEWDSEPKPVSSIKGSPIEKVFKRAAEQKEDFKKIQKLQGDNSSKKNYKKRKK